MKIKSNKNVEEVNEKFCKKCGDPIRSTSKYKLCENCRRNRAQVARNTLGTVGGVVLTVGSLLIGKNIKKK